MVILSREVENVLDRIFLVGIAYNNYLKRNLKKRSLYLDSNWKIVTLATKFRLQASSWQYREAIRHEAGI